MARFQGKPDQCCVIHSRPCPNMGRTDKNGLHSWSFHCFFDQETVICMSEFAAQFPPLFVEGTSGIKRAKYELVIYWATTLRFLGGAGAEPLPLIGVVMSF